MNYLKAHLKATALPGILAVHFSTKSFLSFITFLFFRCEYSSIQAVDTFIVSNEMTLPLIEILLLLMSFQGDINKLMI